MTVVSRGVTSSSQPHAAATCLNHAQNEWLISTDIRMWKMMFTYEDDHWIPLNLYIYIYIDPNNLYKFHDIPLKKDTLIILTLLLFDISGICFPILQDVTHEHRHRWILQGIRPCRNAERHRSCLGLIRPSFSGARLMLAASAQAPVTGCPKKFTTAHRLETWTVEFQLARRVGFR